jgi:glycosyltransferase involved in cell wall biosynthesis
MRVLFLAPQPFYEERGTPIAVDRALQVLCERDDTIDLVAYHQGKDVSYKNVTLHRIPRVPFAQNIRPGLSAKKIICDAVMLVVVLRLALRNRYQLVHAVEESVFIALLLKWLFGIPYIYDMDSSLSQQISEKHPGATRLIPVLSGMERIAIQHASAVAPVCEAIAQHIEQYNPTKVVILPDISLLQRVDPGAAEALRATLGIRGTLLLYVGNLEIYQGIDLLLESFALVAQINQEAHLVIIGGATPDIQKYEEKCRALGIDQRVHFRGPRPVDHLAAYLAQADILISPRTRGANTPMKVYSYLDSGRAVLATDLPTHTQVLNDRVAVLADPVPEKFAQAMLILIDDPARREQISAAGHQLIQEEYSYSAFQARLNGLYDWLKRQLHIDLGADSRGVSSAAHTPKQTNG